MTHTHSEERRNMSEDVLYPTYSVTASFVQDGEHQGKPGRWTDGLPEGRVRNLLQSQHKMYKEDPGVVEVERWAADEWWPKAVENSKKPRTEKGKAYPITNPTGLVIDVKFLRLESWCLGWFDHWTFDVGQSDSEVLTSFERYVNRYRAHQDWPVNAPENWPCLMGAEDRWRWTGAPSNDDRTNPPCRCVHCKNRGIIRIGH